MLRFLTSGESHGPAITAIVDGIPSGLQVDVERVNHQLWLRQQGYGRGARQKIESDRVEVLGGLHYGITTGAPLTLQIRNRDFDNWRDVMSALPIEVEDPERLANMQKKGIHRFRPGHADLAGTLKFRQKNIRDVLERASARETAARVAVGAICQQLLAHLGISVASHVIQVGKVRAKENSDSILLLDELDQVVSASPMLCADATAEAEMMSLIKQAWQDGDSLGGVVEVLADGLPVGLGSYTQWDCRLDGRLAQALMSIQAMKAVEVGDGFEGAGQPGSAVHDPIYPAESSPKGLPFERRTNHAGGIEGGVTNGERLKVRVYMKPIPTLRKGLPSVSFPDFKADTAHFERSDVCAISAASVVCKAMVSYTLALALLEKFGGDTMADVATSLQSFRQYLKSPGQSDCRVCEGESDTEAESE